MKKTVFAAVLLGFGLGAAMAQAAEMIELRYVDTDPGYPPYTTRLLVTPDFLRMDTGDDAGDFVLLDRRNKTLFNVLRYNGVAMVFRTPKVPARPADWNAKLETFEATKGTRGFRLTVKGVVCSEGLAAKAAAPDAARALAELKATLIASQHRLWRESPPGMQHDCDLANQVWETGTTLALGLPLEERDFTGRTRKFESESRKPLERELFRVPKGLPRIDAPL